MRLPPGLVRPGHPDTDLLPDGVAVVRGRDRPLDKPRQLPETGIRVRRAGGEATVPRRQGATCHPRAHLLHHRPVGFPNADAWSHSDARTLRRVLVHGSSVTEGVAVLRQNTDHVHAEQVPTRLHVLETGKLKYSYKKRCDISPLLSGTHQASPPLHLNPIHLPRVPVAHKVVQFDFDFVPTHVGRDDRYPKVIGPHLHAQGVENFGRCHAGTHQKAPR